METTSAFDLLAELHVAIRREYRAIAPVMDLALSPLAAQLLTLIARYPDWTQHQLGDATGREKSQVARAMKDLEQHGLINRKPTQKDGRAKAAALTDTAHEVLGQLTATRRTLEKKVFSNLTPEETSSLIDMLQRVLGSLADT